VQGHLRKQPLSVVIRTRCAHSGQPLTLEMDSELAYHVVEAGAEPLVFVPQVDFGNLEDPSIIDAF
jgi:hypothetical protein